MPLTSEQQAVHSSERLNGIATSKKMDGEKVDAVHSFDSEDTYDTQETYNNGLKIGLTLADLLHASGPDARVWLVTTEYSGDEDDFYYFVGTEDSIAARLRVLPDRDSPEDFYYFIGTEDSIATRLRVLPDRDGPE